MSWVYEFNLPVMAYHNQTLLGVIVDKQYDKAQMKAGFENVFLDGKPELDAFAFKLVPSEEEDEAHDKKLWNPEENPEPDGYTIRMTFPTKEL